MEFRILGPLEVLSADQHVVLGGFKQRAVLALLLLRANRVVATSEMLNALWPGEDLPATARKIVQNAVWGLRAMLADPLGGGGPADGDRPALLTQAPGYVLHVAPERLDVNRFERQVAEGRSRLAAGDAEKAANLLHEALDEWRGPALADLAEQGVEWPELTALHQQRLDVMEDRFEAELACGRHQAILGELVSLAAAEPLRERLCGQLMLALYRSGRQAEALGVFSNVRRALVDEYGLEPSRDLQLLQQNILTHDPTLVPPVTPPPVTSSTTAPVAARPPHTEPPRTPEPRHTEPSRTDPHYSAETTHAGTPHPVDIRPAGAPHLMETPPLGASCTMETAAPENPHPVGTPALEVPPLLRRPPVEIAHERVPSAVRTPPRAEAVRPERRLSRRVAAPTAPGGRTAPGGPVSERRQVSVLLTRTVCADEDEALAGEPGGLSLRDMVHVIAESVEELGGAVIGSLGHDSLALFGLKADRPAASLDAVTAALTLRDRFSELPGASYRAAVVAGEALVRHDPHDPTAPVTVVGQLLDEAQSLLASTPWGEVYVGGDAARVTGVGLRHRPVPTRPEGVADVRQVRAVDGGRLGGEGLPTEHEPELGIVSSLLDRTRCQGTPHLVTILGERGVGKSRFLAEFERRAKRQPDSTWIMRLNVSEYESDVLRLARDTLATRFGLPPSGSVDGRFAEAVRAITGPGATAERLQRSLNPLMGPAPHIRSGEELIESWVELLVLVAREEPVVLCLDDVHQADEQLLDVIEELVFTAQDVPLFVVACGEPELLERRPFWGSGQRHAGTLTLDRPSRLGRRPSRLPGRPMLRRAHGWAHSGHQPFAPSDRRVMTGDWNA
ncbi:BTAD domain-containing putative transcriptional regulator [Streptomyces asiaticus]|uniref:BTAD domain-containing putative transcriptional regulator n=1 Tax=Streptomyces asiaticus TaxID=114695 RepID=UPI003D738EF5